MFAARALAAIALTVGTVTPIACAPSAHVATPATSGAGRVIGTHHGSGSGTGCGRQFTAAALTARAPSCGSPPSA
ncbi:hypothetical protein AB0N09_39865 [Streptomyces erythrochromogenes]|uniref:hypothetical protein n=1 Tax=Streptomyces erythrochromogenes TaxID=285574 RepID=UPI00343F30DA